MTSLLARRPAHVRRLGAAAVLAATALLGTTTGTFADSATACAAPKKPGFDRGGYQTCVDIADDQWERGEITEKDFNDAMWDCCYDNGGEIVTDSRGLVECVDPAEGPAEGPWGPWLPQVPGPTEQAPPPPPPPGPMVPLPGVPPVQSG